MNLRVEQIFQIYCGCDHGSYRGGSRNFGKGGGGTPTHVNAEGAEKMERFFLHRRCA